MQKHISTNRKNWTYATDHPGGTRLALGKMVAEYMLLALRRLALRLEGGASAAPFELKVVWRNSRAEEECQRSVWNEAKKCLCI